MDSIVIGVSRKKTNAKMSWLRSKSYTLKPRRDKKGAEKMDVILKGILESNHPDAVKKNLLQKIAEKGSQTQTTDAIWSVFDLTSKWVFDGKTELETVHGLKIFLSWAKYNKATFEHFFSKEYLSSLLSKKCKNLGRVPVYLLECMRLLQTAAEYRQHCTVIEEKASNYVREHPFLECLKNFSVLLLEVSECIPKGELTHEFCRSMIHSLSLCSPEEGSEAIIFIKDVSVVASLIEHVWNNTDSATVLESLKVIFGIISSSGEIEPSFCLGSLVQFIPQEMINIVIKNVIRDSSIDNNSMTTAIQRIIDWLKWPTSKFVDQWVIGFLKGLASVQKYSILIAVTENKIDQIFEKLQYPPVREPGMNIVSHMLLSFQHSPDPFHKILPMVPKIVGLLKGDNTPHSQNMMTRLAELLHILMYLHAGFPELYDPIYESIKEYSKPSPDVIKFKLLESKWTAHRDNMAYVPRSYQQKAEMGKTGLFNLGNTCYMNSVLQALYMCDSFRNGLLAHKPSQEQALVVKLQYVFAFLSLSQRPAYAPVNFLAVSRPPWFSAGFQQDCSEFLKYLLDRLHEQEQSFLRQNPDTGVKGGVTKSANGKRQGTLIEQNFGGKMNTSVVCSNCTAESVSEEMFMDIPLAFPDYQVTGQKSLIGGDNKMTTRSANTAAVRTTQTSETSNCLHLTDLLKHYLKPEKLSGDNKYHCNVCGSLQDAERRINIMQTPEYLIFTLLRFSYDTRLHARSKIFREVKYPKTLLLPVTDEERKAARRQRTKSLRSEVAVQLEACGQDVDTDCCDVYALCSVVIHSGTSSDCGHYYCYARHSVPKNPKAVFQNLQNCSNEDEIDFLEDKWFLFNDNRVSYASYSSFSNVTQRFTKDTAYVLIYRKIDPENMPGISVSPEHSFTTARTEQPLRSDLRAAVTKDNKLYLQEQENTAQTKKRPKPDTFNWYNWKDDDDRNSGGSCGGGGGSGSLGDLDTSGARFVF